MSIDEMKEYLIGVQKELPETKILNAILAQQEDIENIRKVLIETQARVNEIINASDIDYIEKKDLLSDYVNKLVNGSEDKAKTAETLRQNIAKQ
jgi:hypothetical protein